MNFYKHFIGDYSRSTGDLSIIEHGAYRLMLDSFYGIGKPLPADKKALYRLLRADSEPDRRAIDNVSLRSGDYSPTSSQQRMKCSICVETKTKQFITALLVAGRNADWSMSGLC